MSAATISRLRALAPLLACLLARVICPSALGALGLVVGTVAGLAALGALGAALVPRAPLSRTLMFGAVAWLLFTSAMLTIGMGARLQTIVAAAVLGAATWRNLRAERASAWSIDWVPVGIALLAACLPLLWHNAFSLPGHDRDSLAHQDGSVHAMLIALAQRGQAGAAAYSIGFHAFVATLANLFGLDAFRALAAAIPLWACLCATSTHALARSWGLSERAALTASLLAATHPLLLFVTMEQYAPQLAACALCAWALSEASSENAEDDWRWRALRVAAPLAALLSVYGLAFVVALPIVVLTGYASRGLRGRALALALGLSFALAPLGVARLFSRSSRIAASKQSLVGHFGTTQSGPVLYQDGAPLGTDFEVVSRIVSWNPTWAHVVGISPFRDHLLRFGARLVERPDAALARRALVYWIDVLIPIASLAIAVLLLLGTRASTNRVGAILVLSLAGVALIAMKLGLIRGYHVFKIVSLGVPALCVLMASGLSALSLRRSALVAGVFLALTRAPALAAIELEYSRDLSLDRDFVALVSPLVDETRGRRVFMLTHSATRRYWWELYVLGEANRVQSLITAKFLLCDEGDHCPPWRTVMTRGSYRLLVAPHDSR